MKESYHKDVVVIHQKKAWIDAGSARDWLVKVLAPYANEQYDGQEFLLMLDNPSTQKSKPFVQAAFK